MMTLPIGGADMPVVISLYNAFTGLAVGLRDALQNPALMIAGMVVGSAGTLLTVLMAEGNEPLAPMCCSELRRCDRCGRRHNSWRDEERR